MKQFTIQCSRCGKLRRVRRDTFVKVAKTWNSGGSTLICPDCAKDCTTLSGFEQTVETMVAWLFDATEAWEGYDDGQA